MLFICDRARGLTPSHIVSKRLRDNSCLSHYIALHTGDCNCVLLLPFSAGTFLSDTGGPDDVSQGLNSVEKGANDEEGSDGKDEGKEGHVDEVHWLGVVAQLPVHSKVTWEGIAL